MGDSPDSFSGSLEPPVARIPAGAARYGYRSDGKKLCGEAGYSCETLPMQWDFSSEYRMDPRTIRAGPVTPIRANLITLAGSRTESFQASSIVWRWGFWLSMSTSRQFRLRQPRHSDNSVRPHQVVDMAAPAVSLNFEPLQASPMCSPHKWDNS